MSIAEVPCLFRFVLVGAIQRDFVGVFNKTIIPLGLVGCEMIIANSARKVYIEARATSSQNENRPVKEKPRNDLLGSTLY